MQTENMHEKAKNPRSSNVWITAVYVLLAFVLGFAVRDKAVSSSEFVSGDSGANVNREAPAEYQDVDFDLFWRVWDTIDNSYLFKERLNTADRIYGAIKGMVAASGDPYTIFLTPSENRVTQEDLSGKFSGVGIQIGFRGSQLAVVAPLPDSPAQKAGIKAGDFIVGIKDENKNVERGTQGITLPEAVQLIRGEEGTTVTLSLLREGVDQPILVDVQRQTIDVPSVVFSFEGENEDIAYVQVLKFASETKYEWNDAVLEIQKAPELRGIIVDVRNNPGGYLQGAIDLGSEFMQLGDVVVIEEDAKGNRREFKTETPGRLTREKVVVLVNEGSASASEILAGALRDNENVPVIGTATFGKGSIQEPRQLENGVALHITVSKWLTPDGYWVNDNGLVPDIEVEDNPDTEEDEQLQTAIEYLMGRYQLGSEI